MKQTKFSCHRPSQKDSCERFLHEMEEVVQCGEHEPLEGIALVHGDGIEPGPAR